MSHSAHGAVHPADLPAIEAAEAARRAGVANSQTGSAIEDAPALNAGEHDHPETSLGPLNDNGKQTQHPTPHAVFCRKLGILHYRVEPGNWVNKAHTSLQPDDFDKATPLKATKGGYYEEIKRACRYHDYQYWLVASTINTLYLSQIAIGATATALGSAGVTTQATLARTTAITILTAIGTVVAGVLAFMKSRGQPNRVRQLRNDLRKVEEYIREMEMAFSPPAVTTITVEDALKEVKRLYETARNNAEINYPDMWSTSPKTPTK